MLKKFIFSLSAVIALSLVSMAKDGDTKLTGFVVDKACSAKVAKASDPKTEAGNQAKSCILAKPCFDSGVGIYSDGKFYEFDTNGKNLAKAAIEKSKKDKGVKFEVTGTVTGNAIKVTSLKEVE